MIVVSASPQRHHLNGRRHPVRPSAPAPPRPGDRCGAKFGDVDIAARIARACAAPAEGGGTNRAAAIWNVTPLGGELTIEPTGQPPWSSTRSLGGTSSTATQWLAGRRPRPPGRGRCSPAGRQGPAPAASRGASCTAGTARRRGRAGPRAGRPGGPVAAAREQVRDELAWTSLRARPLAVASGCSACTERRAQASGWRRRPSRGVRLSAAGAGCGRRSWRTRTRSAGRAR